MITSLNDPNSSFNNDENMNSLNSYSFQSKIKNGDGFFKYIIKKMDKNTD
jgi:hypothetical protein